MASLLSRKGGRLVYHRKEKSKMTEAKELKDLEDMIDENDRELLGSPRPIWNACRMMVLSMKKMEARLTRLESNETLCHRGGKVK